MTLYSLIPTKEWLVHDKKIGLVRKKVCNGEQLIKIHNLYLFIYYSKGNQIGIKISCFDSIFINLNNQVHVSFIFVLNQISRSSAGEIILNNGTYLLLIPNHVENFHSLYLYATYLRKRTGKKGFNSLISFSILKHILITI